MNCLSERANECVRVQMTDASRLLVSIKIMCACVHFESIRDLYFPLFYHLFHGKVETTASVQ